ncbi:MAG TPA: hypothetical protein VGP65_17345 [Candidatus Angelobacter sp.]|nr:hypothetical protein [Candidatus Angelobacter sp.]
MHTFQPRRSDQPEYQLGLREIKNVQEHVTPREWFFVSAAMALRDATTMVNKAIAVQ